MHQAPNNSQQETSECLTDTGVYSVSVSCCFSFFFLILFFLNFFSFNQSFEACIKKKVKLWNYSISQQEFYRFVLSKLTYNVSETSSWLVKRLAGCNSKKHCLYFCEVTEAKNYLNLKETITHKWFALRTWKSGKQSWVVEMQMLNNYNWSLPGQFFLTGSCQYHYSPTSEFKEKWARNKFINTSCENNTRSRS